MNRFEDMYGIREKAENVGNSLAVRGHAVRIAYTSRNAEFVNPSAHVLLGKFCSE